jgi:hypothetical protein
VSAILSREKGAEGEREAADYLTHLFKLPVNRTAQYCGAAGHPDVEGLDGIHVEVKRRQRLHLESALQQAVADASVKDVPLVLHRANHERWKITLYGDDLLRFLDAANCLIEEGHRRALESGTTPVPAAESPAVSQEHPRERTGNEQ